MKSDEIRFRSVQMKSDQVRSYGRKCQVGYIQTKTGQVRSDEVR